MKHVLLISGPVASGKTTLAIELSNHFNMDIIQTRELLQRSLPENNDSNRKDLQDVGDQLDNLTGGRWIHDELVQRMRNVPSDSSVVIDSVRTMSQIEVIRETYGVIVTHIHLTAPQEILEERYYSRLLYTGGCKKSITYQDILSNQTELMVEDLQLLADIVIDTDKCSDKSILSCVIMRLEACSTNRNKDKA